MQIFDQDYWEKRYNKEETGWDIGYPSTPLKTYFDQLTQKDLKILIPGGGNAYEAEYLFQSGFANVYLLDWSITALRNFKKRVPNFPEEQLIEADFFKHTGQYDLIVEQTFFCALPKEMRTQYAQKMFELLRPQAKLIGLLFNREFEKEGPPFGGSIEEYQNLFAPHFNILVLDDCYNSIPPRQGAEAFIIAQK